MLGTLLINGGNVMSKIQTVEKWYKEVQSKCPEVEYEVRDKYTHCRFAMCKLTGAVCTYLKCRKRVKL